LSVSLKMDKTEYRAVIKFFVKEGLTPMEIHSRFIKVYGDSSPSFSTIIVLYRRLGGPQGRSGVCGKSRPPAGIRSPDRTAHNEFYLKITP